MSGPNYVMDFYPQWNSSYAVTPSTLTSMSFPFGLQQPLSLNDGCQCHGGHEQGKANRGRWRQVDHFRALDDALR